MLRGAALIFAALCIAPFLVIAGAWFLPISSETVSAWQHVVQFLLADYITDTMLLGLGVAFTAVVVGVSTAWVSTRFSFFGESVLLFAMILPLAVPAYVSAYAYGWLFEYAGPLQTLIRDLTGWQKNDYYFPQFRNLGGSIVVIGFSTVPYVYLLARTAFLTQPLEWWQAASSMGSNSSSFFWRVALPAARPFIFAGGLMALMEALADIGTVTIMNVQSFGAGIYRSWFYLGEPLVAARLAAVLFIFVFFLMIIEAFNRRRQRFSSILQNHQNKKIKLSPFKSFAAFLLCSLPVVVGFLIPVLVLFRLLSYNKVFSFEMLNLDYIWHTLRLGGLSGLIVAIVALIMTVAERFYPKGWLRYFTGLANLGYAVPGAILAVGLMLLFGWLQKNLFPQTFITGTILALLVSYVVRFLATAYHPLQSGFTRIPQEFDQASAALGKNNFVTFFRVQLPLLWLSLCVAFLVVFLDTVKELSATLILRPFDVKNLAIVAFEFASDDRHVEAAPYALILIGISTMAVFILFRLYDKLKVYR
jgi:iron(III) transport system permease protein